MKMSNARAMRVGFNKIYLDFWRPKYTWGERSHCAHCFIEKCIFANQSIQTNIRNSKGVLHLVWMFNIISSNSDDFDQAGRKLVDCLGSR